jgi:hypothetical protein
MTELSLSLLLLLLLLWLCGGCEVRDDDVRNRRRKCGKWDSIDAVVTDGILVGFP